MSTNNKGRVKIIAAKEVYGQEMVPSRELISRMDSCIKIGNMEEFMMWWNLYFRYYGFADIV